MAPVKKTKKKVKKSKGPPKPILKGLWLSTPELWAEFDKWAEVNAQPRKFPEPEPIVRESKPLSQLRKHVISLSRPSHSRTQGSASQCTSQGVSRAALRYKASKNIKRLGKPSTTKLLNALKAGSCKEPGAVRKSALRYEITDSMRKLARPKISPADLLGEDGGGCRAWKVSRAALKHKTNKFDDRLALPKCYDPTAGCAVWPPGCKVNCRDIGMSAWMEFLALPGWRVLMYQDTERSERWREQIWNELGERGRQALEEKMKRKEEEERKKGKKIEYVPKDQDEGEMDEEAREKRRRERDSWRFIDMSCKPFPPVVPESAKNYEAPPEVLKFLQRMAEPKKKGEDDCKDPWAVSELAKNAPPSPLFDRLAIPKYPCEPVTRAPPREHDEFGRPILPKPPYGRQFPKIPPRPLEECKRGRRCSEEWNEGGEGDEAYDGDAEAPGENAKGNEECEKMGKMKANEKDKEEEIVPGPLVLKPTIDPLFDPVGAAKQMKQRTKYKEELKNAKKS
ncbi:hypothetical protein QAD02_022432 [Eretmocerus hayati]|uniref:Uncharacterized protein n=1 Tax=Eretmocerus hayati TaxID=131215 RepID=A0ACC2PUK8_9HYME|nr:hypothetical protein QAD02_022432 [Eretmocerus hayati]